ncbi:MAG: hypothetical protein GY820_48515 [Gammaproteobacteria bacterium]|nr:hypothetical protein [Gammaproteobacteria bacterium]
MTSERIRTFVPSPEQWHTRIPQDLSSNAREDGHGHNWGSETWFPGKTMPFRLVPGEHEELQGEWYGFQGETSWGERGTLWHGNAYNIFGEVRDLTVWGIGDWWKGREGHGLYFRCVPSLDFKVKNYRAFKLGGQAFQREWRRGETEIPKSKWGEGGGQFVMEDCIAKETGLIDEGTGGNAVRASWAWSLYNTMQHTTLRNVRHYNYHSPAPHEGSLFLGYGSDAWRTPSLLVEDFRSFCNTKDRPEVFLEGVDEAKFTSEKVIIFGENPQIDVTEDCGALTIDKIGSDVTVRIKRASNPHGAPIRTERVKAGQAKVFHP